MQQHKTEIIEPTQEDKDRFGDIEQVGVHFTSPTDDFPKGKRLAHPMPIDELWTTCCGLVLKDNEVLDEPIPMDSPINGQPMKGK